MRVILRSLILCMREWVRLMVGERAPVVCVDLRIQNLSVWTVHDCGGCCVPARGVAMASVRAQHL